MGQVSTISLDLPHKADLGVTPAKDAEAGLFRVGRKCWLGDMVGLGRSFSGRRLAEGDARSGQGSGRYSLPGAASQIRIRMLSPSEIIASAGIMIFAKGATWS